MNQKTTAKHTPGPWTFKKSRHSNGHVNASFLGTIEAPDKEDPTNWAVAAIWENCGEGNKESEANAKLIAAAPDLLEALQGFVNATYAGCSDVELNSLRLKAEAAIGKAA